MAERTGSPDAPLAPRGATRDFWTPRHILWLVILVVLLVFIGQNFDDAEVNLLFWDVTWPLAVTLLLFGVGGYLLGWLRPRFRTRR